MRSISHIVIHTAAAEHDGAPVDQSAATIKAYHVHTKGWSDIGYHFVVRFNGFVELGRPEVKPGAGVQGFNQKTMHVCFTGHGDLAPFTDEQSKAGVALVAGLLDKYNLIDEFIANPMRVLGHRECYALDGVPNTHKTCPGKKVDCKAFRLAVVEYLKSHHMSTDAMADEGDD